MKTVQRKKKKLPIEFTHDEKTYKCRNGYLAVIEDKKAKRICSWLEFPAELRNKETGSFFVEVKFRDRGGERVTVLVPKGDLMAPYPAIQKLANKGLEIVRMPELKKVLSRLWQDRRPSTITTVTSRPGWHEDKGGPVYVTAKWVAPKEAKSRLKLSPDIAPVMASKGTAEGWKKNIASLCLGSSRPTLAVCSAFLGPVLHLLSEAGVAFSFVGHSTRGKSLAMAAAATVYGRADNLATFNATRNALEAMAMVRNDGLLVIDELGQAHGETMALVCYDLINGVSRRRLDTDHQLNADITYRVAILSAGELSISDILRRSNQRVWQGQTVRFITIPIPAGGMFKTTAALSAAAIAKRIKRHRKVSYGAIGKKWIKHLASNPEGVADRITRLRARELNGLLENPQPQGLDGSIVERVAGSFALVAAVGEYAVAKKFLPWPKGTASAAIATCFKAWARHALEHDLQVLEAPIERVRRALIAETSKRFLDREQYDASHVQQGVGGYRHTLNGIPVFLVYRKFFEEQVCKGLAVPVVVQALRDGDYLIPEGRGSALKQVRVKPDTRIPFYVIKRSVVNQ